MEDKQKQIEEMAEELYKAGDRKHTKHVVPRAEVAKATQEEAEQALKGEHHAEIH